MVSPLKRNAPEIIGLMGVGLLLFQHSKYITIMKTKKWVQNIALRINTRFPFAPATLLSSGISLGVRKHICQIREQLTRSARQVESLSEQLLGAQSANAERTTQVESLNRQLEEARSDSAQIREQLTMAQADKAAIAWQVESFIIYGI